MIIFSDKYNDYGCIEITLAYHPYYVANYNEDLQLGEIKEGKFYPDFSSKALENDGIRSFLIEGNPGYMSTNSLTYVLLIPKGYSRCIVVAKHTQMFELFNSEWNYPYPKQSVPLTDVRVLYVPEEMRQSIPQQEMIEPQLIEGNLIFNLPSSRQFEIHPPVETQISSAKKVWVKWGDEGWIQADVISVNNEQQFAELYWDNYGNSSVFSRPFSEIRLKKPLNYEKRRERRRQRRIEATKRRQEKKNYRSHFR